MRRTNRGFRHIAVALFIGGMFNPGLFGFLVVLGMMFLFVVFWRLFRTHIVLLSDVALGRSTLLGGPSRLRRSSHSGASDIGDACGE